VPVAIETLGAWGEDARRLLLEIGRRVAKQTQEPRARAFLTQRISLAIQRGNAASVLGSIPREPGLKELLLT
jgi:hypothetical protein